MVELIVKNMHCSSCATRVTRALKQIDSTAEVTVDLQTQRVRVTGMSGDEAREAIEQAGYPARVSSFAGEPW